MQEAVPVVPVRNLTDGLYKKEYDICTRSMILFITLYEHDGSSSRTYQGDSDDKLSSRDMENV